MRVNGIAAAIVCVVGLGLAQTAHASNLTLAWDASSGATGYVVSYGTQHGVYTRQLNVGNQTTATIQSLNAGTTYFFAVQAYNTLGTSPYSTEVSAPAPPETNTPTNPPTDLFVRGTPEIVWQQDGGNLIAWFMNGTSVNKAWYMNPSSTSDSNYRVIAVADFNRDGSPDLLWQHKVNGSLVVWFMTGNTMTSAAGMQPSASTDLSWKIAGVGDFNLDGYPDLLWQNQTNGQLLVWYMGGAGGVVRQSAAFLNPIASADLNWKVAAVADFNGDGRPDLLWQNSVNGGLIAWLMNGTTLQTGQWLSPSASGDLNWVVAGAADVNADGRPDLIWRNKVTGGLIAWIMSGTTSVGGQFLSPSAVTDLTWKIAGIK